MVYPQAAGSSSSKLIEKPVERRRINATPGELDAELVERQVTIPDDT